MLKTPFVVKSPFRGKRGFFRALPEAEIYLERLGQCVDSLIEAWKIHGLDSGITLQVEPRNKKLRWRATVKQFNHQKLIDFDGPELKEIRGKLSDPALVMLIGFEHRRLVLNMEIVKARLHIAELTAYTNAARELEAIAPESIKTPIPKPRERSAG